MESTGTMKLTNDRTGETFNYKVKAIGHNMTLIGKHGDSEVVMEFFQANTYDIDRLREKVYLLDEERGNLMELLEKCGAKL